ncbi:MULTISPECIES: ArsR/SmtB family transcription factor [Flavobacteriaceae]|jgi:DNA-binding transcriptional ArsR family regulator|uniref:ArsR/SmtB family transcription factor n=1 Tax=Gelatiniphilus marinus TaxID=1759464 RepID=A0ABW5JUK2_9FLAO|nr:MULTISPECIES: metalloregulator ArsR/SmtB family transcription factor [Flavobacteriaceae]MAG86171.1 transcriptional regulator [Flavobacteriaceae bacterium]MCK0192833.1 metalloregulator ArsR/SmtB family transcription factor [Arenibacter sp. F20364]MDL5514955.1 metalloregulator ArsR/SmtB family transcription factor [Arenibacter sp. M-2]MDO6675210.1 metalloregulator ArsR/SmtB family transcription factor [Tenacibaculum sp. 1_MG-2023]|tara:strand:+ start:661 stop:1035 length:375 start_codon:yes stop_codon:yes gene_type:complete
MDNNSCIRQQADLEQINRCKDTVSELNESFDYLANGLSLVGNSVRLKILYLLFEEDRLCVCDLSDILGMNISAISQHLRKMKDRNLLETDREAQTIYYSLTAEYEKLLNPFFAILDKNKVLEAI